MKKISKKAPKVAKIAASVMSINSAKLKEHIDRVYLGGIVEEAILFCDENTVLTTAIDETNAIFVYIQSPISLWEGQLGLGNLGILSKFLGDASEEVTLKKTDNRLNITKTDGPSLKYLLTDPPLISTYNEVQEGVIQKLEEKCTHAVAMTKEAMASFLYMTNLLKPKIVTLQFDGSLVNMLGGLDTEHQFTLDIGEAELVKDDASEEAFAVTIYADHLKAILSVLKGEDEEPTLIFGDGQPIIVQLDEGNIWALLPVTG